MSSLNETGKSSIEGAKDLKESGNDFFSKGEYRKALSKYKKVFLYVNGLLDKSDDISRYSTSSSQFITEAQSLEIKQIKISTFSNIALCYLKLEAYDSAVDFADRGLAFIKSLEEKPSASVPVSITSFKPKLMFRKSLALDGLKRFDDAYKLIIQALKLEPNNKEMRISAEGIKLKYKNQLKDNILKQKNAFGGVLN